MLVFNLIKISTVVNFLPVGWFSSSANSDDDHGNVRHVKDVTDDVVLRKDVIEDIIVKPDDSLALCEQMRKTDQIAAPSYARNVSKPAASTSRQSADYAPAAMFSKSRSAQTQPVHN